MLIIGYHSVLFLFKQSESPSLTGLSNEENVLAPEIVLASCKTWSSSYNNITEDFASFGLSAHSLQWQLLLSLVLFWEADGCHLLGIILPFQSAVKENFYLHLLQKNRQHIFPIASTDISYISLAHLDYKNISCNQGVSYAINVYAYNTVMNLSNVVCTSNFLTLKKGNQKDRKMNEYDPSHFIMSLIL
jgi:hypothetical protein